MKKMSIDFAILKSSLLIPTNNIIVLDKFPDFMKAGNDISQEFDQYNLSKLRNAIVTLILERKDENDYFEIDKWRKTYLKNKIKKMDGYLKKIIEELTDLGWTCKYTFGSTALFIYKNVDDPPSMYHEEGF